MRIVAVRIICNQDLRASYQQQIEAEYYHTVGRESLVVAHTYVFAPTSHCWWRQEDSQRKATIVVPCVQGLVTTAWVLESLSWRRNPRMSSGTSKLIFVLQI